MQNEGLDDNHIKERLKKGISWLKGLIKTQLHFKNPNLPYYITIFLSLTIFIAVLILFIELTDELAENELTDFDRDISSWIQSYRSDKLTTVVRIVTELGDRYAYLAVIASLGFFLWFRFNNWRFTLQIISVLILSTISNIVVKRIVDRERPTDQHLVFVDTLSYPSGHSMSAMAFYGTLIYLCLNSGMHIFVRIILTALCGAIIISTGLSRIYLGVHFPSDVLGGFIGGLIWVTLSIVLLNTLDLWKNYQAKNELSN